MPRSCTHSPEVAQLAAKGSFNALVFLDALLGPMVALDLLVVQDWSPCLDRLLTSIRLLLPALPPTLELCLASLPLVCLSSLALLWSLEV